MERKIIIRDYLDTKKEINISNFEKVLKITCTVLSGDEILMILYDDLSEEVFDSSNDRSADFFDSLNDIYIKNKLDLIDAFNIRKSSYDEINVIKPFKTGMTCNLCNSKMSGHEINGTFIYTCNDTCPNIQFEYIEPKDFENFKHFMEIRRG